MVKACNKVIELSFYAVFSLTPIVFWKDTFELFEFNKMWLVFGLTIVVASFWAIKMVIQRRILIQRTPLDIPILLFLLSQIISTIFSLDRHVSLWGYYSRFNGGLLSILSYIFLYYAFLSNFLAGDATGRAPDSAHLSEAAGALAGGKVAAGPAVKMVKRLLFLSLISGAIVVLWSLPSHFGFDPTCLLFRGRFDVSCWTESFQPKIRIFGTLGQPDWLAAYLAILIPLSIATFLNNSKTQNTNKKSHVSGIKYYVFGKGFILNTYYLILTTLFYVDLLYTRARSGFLALWTANAFFWLFIFIRKMFPAKIFVKYLLIFNFSFLILTFFIGSSISQIDKFTLSGIKESFAKKQTAGKVQVPNNVEATKPVVNVNELGGTDSGRIRMIVWKGALNAFYNNPLFGTGVETFAFAYYKYKEPSHNLVSEWNFLYNKAHNEYLNYLATTGIFGLGSYLLMIGAFLFLSVKKIKNHPFVAPLLRARISNIKNARLHLPPPDSASTQSMRAGSARADGGQANQNSKLLTLGSGFDLYTLIFALLAGYISILVTNFFGFSVVIVNLYLFLIPAFAFVLLGMINPQRVFVFPATKVINDRKEAMRSSRISGKQWVSISIILIASLFSLISLLRFFSADRNYALGYNLDRAGSYQNAYPHLRKAVAKRPGEPVFQDELAINNAILAVGLLAEKKEKAQPQVDQTIEKLVKEAIETSSKLTSSYPNNVLFWKSRTRIFYVLAQANPQYLTFALEAIKKAKTLAPNDANISYNLGVLEGQNGKLSEAIKTLEDTIKLKPDYKDAYYALGLFYHQSSLDKNSQIVDVVQHEKAVSEMQYILNHLQGNDIGAKQALETWGK